MDCIVVDSTTKLRKDFLKEIENKISVKVVPVRVYIDDQEFEDSDEIFDKITKAIEENKKLETSLPSVSLVEKLFQELSSDYEHVYVLSVSSMFSGTYNLFSTIASKYENIAVFDSKTVNIQNTYIFERMVKDILSGKILEDDDIISYRDDSMFLISVFDTGRLHKSGRVGKVVSLIGKIMHIKPILTIERTGEVGLVGKALTSKKVLDILIERFDEFVQKNPKETKGFILYAAVGSEKYKEYVYEIARYFSLKPMFLEIGSAVTGHVGLEGFGIVLGKDINGE
ncbi:MAG: DegV family protein [Fervidobacterium sp.]